MVAAKVEKLLNFLRISLVILQQIELACNYGAIKVAYITVNVNYSDKILLN